MVICKYFLRGTCRFGENCKNEHTYNTVPDNTGSVMRKKQDIDPNLILKSVSNDMDKSEHGHQWPFSCYGPFQGKPCFPGFEDKSFEEVRFEMTEAEKSGSINQYKQQLMQLLNEVKMKMRSLQNPTQEATNLLKELFNNTQETQNTVFAPASNSIFGSSQPPVFNPQTNIFQNQASTNTNYPFAQNKSIFGATPTSNTSIFQNQNQNQPSNTPIYGGANNSIFSNTQTTNYPQGNIFQSANQNFTNTGNIFGSQFPVTQQQPTTIFNNSPFSQNVDPSSLFQQNTNDPFKQNTVAVDPFKQNTVAVDPFKQNTVAVDPFQQNTVAVDPFKQNTVAVDPFKQNTVAVDPFKQNSTAVDPFKQNSVADAFKQNSVVDGFKQNTVDDPFKQMTSADPFKQMSSDPFKPNIFQQNSQQFSTPFSQNSILTQQNQESSSRSIFGSSQTTMIQVPDRRQDDPTIYSKLEELNEKDVKCFEAAVFEFGNIPVNPPTLQMC